MFRISARKPKWYQLLLFASVFGLFTYLQYSSGYSPVPGIIVTCLFLMSARSYPVMRRYEANKRKYKNRSHSNIHEASK